MSQSTKSSSINANRSGAPLSKVALVDQKTIKTGIPSFGPGDTIRVHAKIKEGDKERIQLFEGVVVALNNSGARRSFTVRKISHGVGVERVYPMHSPSVVKVDVVEVGKVRRSKVYFVRGRTGKAAKIRAEGEMQ